MTSDNFSFSNTWKNDFISGIVVFLVALPLCLGIALASGAPLYSGIIAGIAGGIIVTTFSGSALGVSGPAAGLAVIVADAIGKLGYEPFLLAVVIAGILQVIAGYAKAGIVAHYFPSAVIKGMLAGIGVIIFLKQIPHALGYDRSWEGELEFIQADGHNTFEEIIYAFQYHSIGAVVITIISLAIMIMWESKFIKKIKSLSMVPAPLLVVFLGVGLNELYKLYYPEWALANEPTNTHLVSLPVSESFSEFLSFFVFPDFSQITNKEIYITAATIAVVASLESLLSAEATDKLDPYKRVTPTNQELRAQGFGNIASGLVGGIPVTQVIVRSSTNVMTGGKTKLASLIHGILLLLCVALIPAILNKVPLASLAAILLVIGYKLAKPALFKTMFRNGLSQFIPFVATVLGLVFTDMLTGIGIGLVVAIFNILINNYKIPYYYKKEKHQEGEKFTIKLSQEVTFLNKASISMMLENLPKKSEVTIDGTESVIIDHDVKEIIEDFAAHADLHNITLKIKGIKGLNVPQHMVINNNHEDKDASDEQLKLPNMSEGRA
ncbi:SulP family inorganic anion transporter [Limibacter armeniacum]|uniref:SulP family inorganic anion transporter n=1 Tax=Limibacter armeniacum TaxID=466084 RepID=UPI002FE68B0F